jgi:hypothetical protein
VSGICNSSERIGNVAIANQKKFFGEELIMSTVMRHAFVLVALAFIFVAQRQAHAAPVQPAVPTASWLFNDGSGSTAAAFNGGAGENGTLNGSATWDNQAPFLADGGKSINTASAGSVLAPGFSIGSAGTISTWVHLTSNLAATNYLYDSTDGSPFSFRNLYIVNGAPSATELNRVSGTDTINGDWANGTNINGGVWHNIVFTWDNSLATNKEVTYLDGVSVATANVSVVGSTPTTWYFGSRFDFTGSLQGDISEYGIWGTALSSDNASWLAANSLTQLPEPSALSLLGIGGLLVYRRRHKRMD